MGNSYFQFKQFKIEQDQCAMKVSTDACIQGAWMPIGPEVKRVLDAGAGTGLLSLMLAQRNKDIQIDAIELDEKASVQAKENVSSSPWSERINVINGDAREYPFEKKYDLLVCNPPFFQNSLLGENPERNNARHTLTFEYGDLVKLMGGTVNEEGYASVLLPYSEMEQWLELLKNNKWNVVKALLIRPRVELKVNRVICICSRTAEALDEEMLIIYSEQNKYSEDTVALLSPFYLNL